MRTKKEILNEVGYSYQSPETHQAMDEYAKELSIGFAEWIDSERYHRFADEHWWNIYDPSVKLTTDELYTLYMDSLK